MLIKLIKSNGCVGVIQSEILAFLMIIKFILVKGRNSVNTYRVKSILITFLIGLGLGVVSSFLGIGGGPLSVAVLHLLFSIVPRNTTINSIFIIFLWQLSALFTVGLTTEFSMYDISMLGYTIAGGVTSGIVGTILASKFSDDNFSSF